MSKPSVMNIWGPLRSGMTKVSLLNGTDRCLSDWLNLFDWATGRLRLHKSFKGRRICKCEKKREGKKRWEKKSPRFSFVCKSTQSEAAFRRVYLSSLNALLTAPSYPCSFRSSAFHKNCKLGKSVNCRHHWLEWWWGFTKTKGVINSFWFRPKSTPHYRSLHSFAQASPSPYGGLTFSSAPFFPQGCPNTKQTSAIIVLDLNFI